MSFLYPRTIAITRPTQPTGVGQVGYGAVLKATEQAVTGASALPASIQQKRDNQKVVAGLPADGRTISHRIFVPLNSASIGLINDRDIVTDDLGNRYQVVSNYWNSLGYNLLCELLEN